MHTQGKSLSVKCLQRKRISSMRQFGWSLKINLSIIIVVMIIITIIIIIIIIMTCNDHYKHVRLSR